MRSDRVDAVIGLLTAVIVTVWARRIIPRLAPEPVLVGYVHRSTIRAIGFNGVPVHSHPDEEPDHLALYARYPK